MVLINKELDIQNNIYFIIFIIKSTITCTTDAEAGKQEPLYMTGPIRIVIQVS